MLLVGTLPESLTQEEVLELTQKYRETGQGKELLINAHLRLVLSIVRRYIQKVPFKAETILSDAMYALVRAVERARTNLKDNNIAAYITVNVYNRIRDGLLVDNLIPIPAQTLRKYGLEQIWIGNYVEQAERIGNVHELREEIYIHANDEFEKHLIWLKEQGHDYGEIETITGWNKTSLSRFFTKIKRKFRERNPEFEINLRLTRKETCRQGN